MKKHKKPKDLSMFLLILLAWTNSKQKLMAWHELSALVFHPQHFYVVVRLKHVHNSIHSRPRLLGEFEEMFHLIWTSDFTSFTRRINFPHTRRNILNERTILFVRTIENETVFNRSLLESKLFRFPRGEATNIPRNRQPFLVVPLCLYRKHTWL